MFSAIPLTSCRYLYMLTVAVDACFRLKRRMVSNETKDPILGSGWGYFVEDSCYKEVLAEYKDQEEVRRMPLYLMPQLIFF